jgi:serine/threonine protein kinase
MERNSIQVGQKERDQLTTKVTLNSTEEEETKSDSDKYSCLIGHQSRMSSETESKLQESITDSIVGSINEGAGSMVAQRIPPSERPDRQKVPLTKEEEQSQALWDAAMKNRPDLIRDLLSLSIHEDQIANTNSRDFHNVTALHIAASEGYVSVCEALLDYGSGTEIDPRNVLDRTPLHLSCIRGHLEVSQLLVRSGADVNSQDFEGNTPLHLAVEQGYMELIAWLLTKSPNVALLNKTGKNPMQCTNNPEIINLIKEYCRRNKLDLPTSGKTSVPKNSDKPKNEPKRIQISDIAQGNDNKDGKVGPMTFEVLQVLGKGSFGEVFLVQKRDSKMLYAMKVLRKDKIMGQNLIKYAKTERNVLSYVKHPFIVSLNYAFQTPEKLFLILDYCPGGDLGFQINREKKFDEFRARIYVCEVLLALEELHKRDIIFRDLKPDNIVLDEEGHAMLTDFGLSKEGVYDNSMARSFCGSVAYLAPEMIKRQGHGKAVDWYLLGVLLYEMLTGTPPYFNPNREQLYQNIQTGKLKLPSCLAAETKSLLKELMQRDQTKRLGARRDAEEVKEHRYFAGINWDSVLRRELKPPMPIKPILMPVYIPLEKIYGDLNKIRDSFNSVPGWTFISDP